ncbi:MAG TPA: dihydropteroate synthase [Candidatus Deferrimicrobium sp.]|nr:dihydropteroate synthase [Candidatus Deferrimicrobium sp.]
MTRFTTRVLEVCTEAEARQALTKIGADPGGINVMIPKALHKVIKVENVAVQAAQILKQEMLSKGGEVAVHKGVIGCSIDRCDVVLMGTKRQYNLLCAKLKAQPFMLKEIGQSILKCLENYPGFHARTLDCRGYNLPLGKQTLIMGILNITPDSFSDGGSFYNLDRAVEHALEMVNMGADIIDIGGESTRPTADYVTAEEEKARLLPVIQALVEKVGVPISVDTYKAEVARATLQAGAHIINDIWGLQAEAEPEMVEVIAEFDAPVIIMHNQKGTEYRDLMGDMFAFFQNSIDLALAKGVKPERIVLDPGIGFGKTTEQNLQVMARLGEFRSLGYPILLGTSRKSMIGNILGVPVNERLEGTGATVTLGIAAGVDIVRVHDVKEIKRVCQMTDAIVRGQRGMGYDG